MFYIDSNIFLEVELQNRRWKECRSILEKVANGSLQSLISTFHLYGIMLRIQNETRSVERIEKFVMAISQFRGLTIYEAKIQDWLKCLEVMKSSRLDFGDSLVVACMVSNGTNELISLDKHFDKFRQLKRLDPESFA